MLENIKVAGIIIFTHTFHKKEGELVALLHRRGRWNLETGRQELYPYGCEVSAHGKVLDEDEGDRFHAAMREVERELGPLFAKVIGVHINDISILCDSPTKITYGIILPPDVLKYIRLEASAGGMELISQDELVNIQNLMNFSKADGVTDLGIIAMYADEVEALKAGFKKFGSR
jgi:hypothetical protein